MKNTIQINYWTIGGFAGDTPLEQALDEAAEMGYGGLEPAFDGKAFGPGITEDRCREIRRAARARGLAIETLASGYYWGCSLSDTRTRVREKAVRYTREYLRAAKRVGAKTVLVVPGAVAVPWQPDARVVPYDRAWKLAKESLRRCVPLAEKLGINIGLENVWNRFLTDPVAMKTFIDEIGSRRVGAYLDVGNCALNGYAEDWIAILGRRRIKAVHLKNFTRTDCAGGLHGFGDDILAGDVDMQSIRRSLAAIGYTGPLTAEMIPFCRLPDPVLPDLDLARDTAAKLNAVFT